MGTVPASREWTYRAGAFACAIFLILDMLY